MAERERHRVKMHVTEKDIERAHRNDSFSCVVVQAVARTLPKAHHIEVDTQTVRWTEDGVRYLWLTPPIVQDYVIAFDAGEEIDPFSFSLSRRTPVRRQKLTEAGAVIGNARTAVKTAKAAQERVERAAAQGEATPKQVKAAAAKVAKAERYLDEVKAERQGQKQTMRDPGPETSKAPRRVIKKTRHRAYGQRALRINWPENEDHSPAEARKLAEKRLGRTLGPRAV